MWSARQRPPLSAHHAPSIRSGQESDGMLGRTLVIMASKGLTELWNAAMAAEPSDWKLEGVVLGPRQVDPTIHGKRWAAWATGPNGPEDALLALTVQLKGLSR